MFDLDLSTEEKLKLIRDYYEKLSDVDFRQRLENAGFKVRDDIPGKVLNQQSPDDFTISVKVNSQMYKVRKTRQVYQFAMSDEWGVAV